MFSKRAAILLIFLPVVVFAQSYRPQSAPTANQFPNVQSAWSRAQTFPNPQRLGPGGRMLHPPFAPWSNTARAFPRTNRHPQTAQPTLDASSIFLEAPTYDSGGDYAQSVAIADLNGDGKLDVVVGNNGSGVGVLLGNGDGTFQPAVTYGSSGGIGVVIADVNGDGKPDILMAGYCVGANCADSGVGVLLGNGDGTFQPAVAYSSGGYSNFSVAVADVNSDGKPDLVVTNYCVDSSCSTDGSVGVLLGNGDGTFKPVVTMDSGGYFTVFVTVADVNGDGKPDLLIANNCLSATNCANGSVTVLLGNGGGTFKPPLSFGSGGYEAESIAAADVNSDGKLDLVVVNALDTNDVTGVVGVLLGNGDGTFQPAVTYDAGGRGAYSVAVADVNGDGNSDLLVASGCVDDYPFSCSTGALGVLLGNGDGTFQTASFDSGEVYAFSVAAGDVNGDAKTDVIVAGPGALSSGEVSVLLGKGDGSFQAAVNFDPGGYAPLFVAAGDVNGDGYPDLVVVDQAGSDFGSFGPSELGVLLNNGKGAFPSAVAYPTGGDQAQAVAVADVNGDGKPDLLVANQCTNFYCSNGSAGVLLGNGDGTFQSVLTYALQGAPNSIAAADVNGDGKPDLLLLSYDVVETLLGNGDGTFQSPIENYLTANGESVAVGDVNGDGKLDLVVANYGDGTPSSGSVSVLLGNGDGTFKPAVTYSSGAIYTTAVALADLNHDGKLDVVIASEYTNSAPYYGVIGVLLGNGDGTFQSPQNAYTPTPLGDRSLAIADFNGDGKLDVAVANEGYLLLGNGDGTFQSPMVLGAGGYGIAVGDFNHDAKPDLAVGGVTVLLNIAQSTASTSTALRSSKNPALYAHPVTFTATVASSIMPTGTVSFLNGSTLLATVKLKSGVAKYTSSSLPSGRIWITAVYHGDSKHSASTSAPVHQAVLISTTTTITSSSANPSSYGQPVTFTAMIASSLSSPPNGEMIAFVESNTVLGTAQLSGGSASLTTESLSTGRHLIKAVYAGDHNFAGSASHWLKQFVK